MFRPTTSIALAALAAAACAHQVTVVTDPPGASVRVDGQDIGRSPARFRESVGSAAHRIEVTLDGYAAAPTVVERSELAAVPAGAVVAGAAALAAAGCLVGALLGNPLALAGVCGGWLVSCANVGLGCQSMCAGLSLCLTAPTVWTVPAASAGGVLGLLPLGALWWLGWSPDQVTIVLQPVAR